jgi:hypothetical protein
MLEREPTRMDDYIDFTYLDMLPECKGIINERLIATGPSNLFFTNTTQPATAFLTDKRLVHLGMHNGMNAAVGSSHEKLAGFRPESTWDITVNWHDPRCPVLGFGPRFSKTAKRIVTPWSGGIPSLRQQKIISLKLFAFKLLSITQIKPETGRTSESISTLNCGKRTKN